MARQHKILFSWQHVKSFKYNGKQSHKYRSLKGTVLQTVAGQKENMNGR